MKRAQAALLSVLLLLGGGCTYSVQWTGDDKFLRSEIPLEVGKTTLAEVAKAYGPPDGVRVWANRIWFLYSFEYMATSGLKLSYYATWFTRKTVTRVDRNLILAFDDDDKLIYHGVGKEKLERAMVTLE